MWSPQLIQEKPLTLTPANNTKKQTLSLLFAGLLPVIAFTVIEQKYGVMAGLIAGMVFGVGEIIYELIRYRKVSTMTWIGNALLLVLGGVSLVSSDGIWFKLQPAIIEAGMFAFLFVTWLIKKPFLVLIIEKQNPTAPDFIKQRLSGMTFRLSLFMLVHAAIATWAAFKWSTEAWALLKSVGLTVSMIFYLAGEIFYTRYQLNKK
jgi:intracellular septation protein